MVRARGVNLQFSINGSSYQDSPVFSNITAGTYTIYVRSTSTRCVRTSNFDFVCAATCPDIASTEIEAPNCEVPESGLLTITLGPGQGNNPKATGGSDPSTPVYEYSIDGGNTWSEHNSFAVSGGSYTVVVRNNETDCTVGDIVTIPCVGCFDGIKNGDETDVDCGGAYCHSCTCPSVADIKASEAQANSGSGGSDGGRGGGVGGGLGGQSGGDDSGTFICDLPEYYDCPNCISYRSCHDDLDNDGDELCDCEDGDCSTWYDEVCVKRKEYCEDGIDNDEDGVIDCMDSDCQNSKFCNFLNDSGNRSASTFPDDALILALLTSPTRDEFLAELGMPMWDKSFAIRDYIVTPTAKLQTLGISGIIITNTVSSTHTLITRTQILNTIKPQKTNGGQETSPAPWPIPEYTLRTAIATFMLADQKYLGNLDIDMVIYLNSEGASSDSSGLPTECDDVCIWVCADETFTAGATVYTHLIMEDKENNENGVPEFACITGFGGSITPVEIGCNQWRQECETLPCPAPIEGSTNLITNGGGSSGSASNTGSEAFNDRIKNCADAGGPNGDPTHEGGEATSEPGFCQAIDDIMRRCNSAGAGGGLASIGLRHVLEALYYIPDCDQGDPATDDAGMLSEVAEYLCENGADGNTINRVRDYVAYASSIGTTNVMCFEQYIATSQFLDERGIYDVTRLLPIRDARNFALFTSLFTGFDDLLEAQAGAITLDLLNYGKKLDFNSPTLETDLAALNMDPGILREAMQHMVVLQRKYIEQHGMPCTGPCLVAMTFEATLKALSGEVHLFLDICGSVSGVGEPCDGINSLFYAVEGDYANATLSATAMIFYLDWTKYSKYASLWIRNANGNMVELVFRKGDDGFIKFGTNKLVEARKHLRSILGLKPGDPRKAHHLIPWHLRENKLVQMAASYKDGPPFHINDIINGIPLTEAQHLTGHAAYNRLVKNYMNGIADTVKNPEEAYNALAAIVNSLRRQLESGKLLREITLP